MQIANIVLSQWGPALLVCFTLVIGLIYQNARLTDFKDSMNRRFEAVDRRFEDLKDYLRSEFKRVDERIDRLESSLARK